MMIDKRFAVAAVAASLMAASACETFSGDGAYDADAEASPTVDVEKLQAVIEARSDADKMRDDARRPAETLSFFGVAPDMTVVEALPGGGWYSRVLIPYLDESGRYAAANYQYEMFPKILPNPTDDVLSQLRGWSDAFPVQAKQWGASGDVAAFEFGQAPEEMKGTVDVVLMVRALHNFNRAGGDFGAEALSESYALLKPGGVLGVVQHAAPAGAEGRNADGSFGYMLKQNVVAMATAAGFVLEAESAINANPADLPEDGDIVWRLPPSFAFGDKDRDAYVAIGESNRMTLRFRKPAE
ncbi:MAG: methyltransferase [Pseudomonadota bacterium]